jgi:glycolate oxidase FAD binding subunit
VDLTRIHPSSKADVVGALREASAAGRRVLPVGGRRHMDRGNPADVDAELWMTQLDRVVAYDRAEMLAVVEAGIRVGELQRMLAGGGQEWPVDAPAQATVGGVVAAGVSSPRRLRVGHVRDTVVELELVTGDGRLIRSGARTVKNVTGFDIHRLATGSLGTLGAIVQVAVKVRPLPQSRRTLVWTGVDGLALGSAILRAAPLVAAVAAGPERVEVHLEGWVAEVDELAEAVTTAARAAPFVLEDQPFPARRVDAAPIVVEAAVPPSRIPEMVAGHDGWTALLGVGLVWFALVAADDVAPIRDRAGALGGIAPAIRGPGGLGPSPVPAPEVHRRLKQSFDPAGILAPGRSWDGV